MFGSGLRVDRAPSKKKEEVFGFHPHKHMVRVSIRITHHLFMEAGNSQLGKKKLQKGKRDSTTGKKSPFNSIPILGSILLNFKLGNL